MKITVSRQLICEIDDKNFTAQVQYAMCCKIPRSITYDSHTYLITNLKECCFETPYKNTDIIFFDDDIQLFSINKNIFCKGSYMKYFTITRNVKELQNGWCKNTPNLTDVTISPENKFFKIIDNNMIVGKSDQNTDKFDILLFAFRDIDYVYLPSYIKQISPFCFENCKMLYSIEFSQNSELQSIGSNAFSNASIEHLFIPAKLNKLEDGWCKNTPNLAHISISPENHNFRIIEGKMIVGKTNQNSNDFDVLVFACRDIEHIKIPSYVKYVSPYCFSKCENLSSVEFDENSDLESIGKSNFELTSIGCLTIPSHVKELKDGWCKNALNLTEISISSENQNYIKIEGKLIIGKTNQNSNDFDVLVFAYRDIEHVIIPSYIRYISPYCFQYCRELKTVEFEINSQLISIGKYSFSHSAIETITIPKHVKSIGKRSFFNCIFLKTVLFDDDSELCSFESESFVNLSLMSITIPKSVKYIGKKAFSFCKNLVNLTFSENSELEIIDEYAFSNCSIQKVKIPSKVTRIGKGAFYGCSSLEIVEFPPKINLATIEEFTFYETKINRIIIPASVRYFERNVFSYQPFSFQKMETIEFEENSQLLNIDINLLDIPCKNICVPDCCQKIDLSMNQFFCNRPHLTIPPKSKNFKIINEKMIVGKTDYNSNEFDTIVYAFDNIEHAIIPSYIKYISPYCFQYCKKLQTVEFEPNSKLISIGTKSFAESSIKSISIPDSVKYIGENVFEKCKFLTSIDKSENSDLESQVLLYDDSFHITKNVSQINYEFESRKINHVTISPENKKFKIINDKMVVGKSNQNSDEFDVLVFACRDIEHVKVPSYIKAISSKCFLFCQKIQSFEFEENSQLTVINKEAFACSSIKKITIPKHVKKICKYSFCECKNIETVEIEENSELEIIGGYSFYRSSIKNIIIPKHVKYINKYAFSGCPNIENLQFEENSELISIKFACFWGTTIKQIVIPSHTQIIEERAFYECDIHETIQFEENSQLTSIREGAFSYSSFERIIIPKHVKIIGKKAFAYGKIKSIEFEKNSEICIIGEKAFRSTSINTIKIPSSVKVIKKFCFFQSDVDTIEFEENSMLHSFNAKAFYKTDIKSIIIPEPNQHNFKCIQNKMIVRKSNPDSDKYDVLVFVYGDIQYLMIPDCINHIDTFCFSSSNLTKIEFSENSKLKTVEKDAFFFTSIKEIIVSDLNESIWINILVSIKNIRISEIHHNLNLKSLCFLIKFPRATNNSKYIENGWYISSLTTNSRYKIIDENMIVAKSTSNSKEFDVLVSAFLGIKQAKIPSHVKHIFPCCFEYCDQIQTVIFENNSELVRIGEHAFNNFCISKITIPSHCKYIEDSCFRNTINLKCVDFEENSRIETIQRNTFCDSTIENIVFPSSVCFVESCVFNCCKKLKSIEFLGSDIYLQDYFIKQSSIEIIEFSNANRIDLGKIKIDDLNMIIMIKSKAIIVDHNYLNSSH